jgi:ferredoxin
MGRPLWVVDLLKKIYPGRFVVAKATRLPIIGRLVDHWLFNGDGLIFLPQDEVVQTIDVDETIDAPGEMVLPSQVVEHFIEQAEVHWIMDFCLCRAAEQCEDYPIDLGCLFLGEAALGINPELGRRVTKEEAVEHVQRCREEGLIHFVGRNKLDTVWLGVGPGDRLLTVCSCCPCCCVWGVLPHVTPRINNKIERMPGVSVRVNDRCVGCGTCTEGVCFMDAIRLEDGRAVIGASCKGCGRCVDVCPHDAVELSIDDERFVDDSIDHISTLVDLD